MLEKRVGQKMGLQMAWGGLEQLLLEGGGADIEILRVVGLLERQEGGGLVLQKEEVAS